MQAAETVSIGAAKRPGIVRKVWRFFREWPVFPIVVLTLLVVCGIFAPLIAPYKPTTPVLTMRNAKPFWYAQERDPKQPYYLLGGDQIGRDVLSRLIYGSRVSLIVVAISLSTGMIIGTGLGLIAGYAGEIVDEVITRIVDMWLAIPFILLALVATIVLGQSFPVLMGLLALVAWVPFVRNVRAEVLVLKTRDYVALSKVAGAGPGRIMIRHILPNVVNTIMVIASLRVGQLILTEAILSFLGAGIPPPTPAWGVMVSDGRNFLSDAWWISFFPGMAILIVVASFNFIGDWTRDRLDPRLRQL